MASPGSPSAMNERVYRFISDPSHKENLSGRVRAACLTCRRKKIKCSGELNCRTCREKGLVCEGLPERKKPRLNPSGFTVMQSTFGVENAKKPKQKTKKKPTPLKSKQQENHATTTLLSPIMMECADSGYGSARADTSEPDLSPTTEAFHFASSPDELAPSRRPSLTTDASSLHALSPATFGSETWSIDPDQAGPQQMDLLTADTFSPPERTLISSDATWVTSMEWVKTQAPMFQHLMDQGSGEVGHSELRQPDIHNFYNDLMENSSYALDNMSRIASNQMCGSVAWTGQKPGGDASSSWWDISDNMTAMLGRGLRQGQVGQAAFPMTLESLPYAQMQVGSGVENFGILSPTAENYLGSNCT